MVIVMPIEEQKYSKFVAAITREANESRERFINEMELVKKDQLEKAREKAASNYEGRILKKEAAIREDCGRDASHKILALRRRLFEERDHIKTQVFDEARKMINDFTKKPEYAEFIKHSAEKLADVIKDGGVVLARAEDEAAVKAAVGPDTAVQADESIILGGIKVKHANVVYDDTLDSRLENCTDWFEQNSKLEID